ncbi:unnamed protein product [Lathyrus oleraceus]|uniref:Uncharacterized protein n=1 Tax=Pisum sativum TaxID=3888 RepID=A0A9D5BC25_PEA|nr:uncharacterized protein LOC127115781 [Pisum sativum]KAI5441772.1 hypothetical protein KIW84_011004 [Pisum sativum]KAI5441773.1 hypothetical protein KIW84_011004 [Pisum sativum]
MENSTDKRKRVHNESSDSVDSEAHCVDSVEVKIRKVDTVSDVNVNSSESESQLTRVDSFESCLDSVFDSDVQLHQDDIFHMLDDAENVPEQTERDSVVGLDSVIKSFEEEILTPGFEPDQIGPVQTGSIQMTGLGEMQNDLGYLFEASDDELGLPPTVVSCDEPGRTEPENVDLTGFLGFEDDLTCNDGFGFGAGLLPELEGGNIGAGDFVTGDGLFDFSEPAVDVLWPSESLQAM